MTETWSANRGGETRRRTVRLLGVIVMLGCLSIVVTAETMSKTYECGDRKMEVSEPKHGVLKASIERFEVTISVVERQGTVAARFRVIVKGPDADSGTQTDVRSVPEALDSACRIVAAYYRSLEAPSGEELAKQLIEFYDQL